ncbi:hypothetical protein SDC9_178488 [bioreactor metagenome]|uniref:Uncharacterized protein n=1 Tax=bioreactor metagenome TaxID=1076179 RepID=A0A645GWF5_9ZZZZ
MAQSVGRQLRLLTGDRQALVAAADDHVEAGLDLPDVLVQRPAQVGQQGVVDRREGEIDRSLLRGRLSLR